MSNTITPTVFYRTLNMEGLEIFYREAGPRDAPTVLLLHGFPSSSHMFRNLIPMLADKYHVVAPDFPGYGESSAPSVNDFDYSYERLATVTEKFTEKLNLSSYALYLSDIGASIGFRLAVMHPEWNEALTSAKAFETEARLRQSNGQYHWFLIKKALAVSHPQSGEPSLRTLIACEDIDDRKLEESARRYSEENYRVVVETASDVIVSIDDGGTIRFANPATERIFGYKSEELDAAPQVQDYDRQAA